MVSIYKGNGMDLAAATNKMIYTLAMRIDELKLSLSLDRQPSFTLIKSQHPHDSHPGLTARLQFKPGHSTLRLV